VALALELDCNSPARIGTSGRWVGSCNASAGRSDKMDHWERPAPLAVCRYAPSPPSGTPQNGLGAVQRWGRSSWRVYRAAAGSRSRLGWPSKLFATFWWSLWWASMNYQAFTNDSLTMMYEGIRGALASDDALSGLGEEPRFRVRETPDWKKHAGELESEMLNRGMFFDVIDWSEDQATLPFEE